ncbi:MAG: Crp/Fnr family transcriptional regulator [Pseudorhodobacter sp.]|nr:Crp/Fnr family transcriptional regulator [Pseudorhodobacter sp.]
MIDSNAQEGLSQIGNLRDYPANQFIGDAETGLGLTGIVISGYLRLQHDRIDGRRQILSLLTPGDIVGRPSGCCRGYSIEASTDARVCRLDLHRFSRMLETDTTIRRAVYVVQSAKLGQLHWLAWSLGALNAEERLCAFLALATRYMPFEPLPGGGHILSVDLPRPDIADFLGTTVESISRISSHLDRIGAIRMRNAWQFEIPDLGKLVQMGCLEGTFENIRFPAEPARQFRSPLQPAAVARHLAQQPAAPKRLATALAPAAQAPRE